MVRTDAGIEEVDVTVVGAVVPGDRVLIHAGTAIGRLDPASEVVR
jgi:hydrogenase maturation factor